MDGETVRGMPRVSLARLKQTDRFSALKIERCSVCICASARLCCTSRIRGPSRQGPRLAGAGRDPPSRPSLSAKRHAPCCKAWRGISRDRTREPGVSLKQAGIGARGKALTLTRGRRNHRPQGTSRSRRETPALPRRGHEERALRAQALQLER